MNYKHQLPWFGDILKKNGYNFSKQCPLFPSPLLHIQENFLSKAITLRSIEEEKLCYSWSKKSRKTISSQHSYEKTHICEHNAKMSSFAQLCCHRSREKEVVFHISEKIWRFRKFFELKQHVGYDGFLTELLAATIQVTLWASIYTGITTCFTSSLPPTARFAQNTLWQ